MASIRNKVKTLENPKIKGKRRGIIIKRRQAFLSELAAAYSDILNEDNTKKQRRGFFRRQENTAGINQESFEEKDYTAPDYGQHTEVDLEKTIRIGTEESEAIKQVTMKDRVHQLSEKMAPAKEWAGNAMANISNAAERALAKIPRREKTIAKKEQTPGIFTERKRRPNYILSVAATSIKMIFIAILVMCFVVAGAAIGVAQAYINTAPKLDPSDIVESSMTSFIYDVNGKPLTEYMDVENREWVAIDDMPDNVKNAVVAVEDVRFYEHNGFDFKRIVGSFISNMTENSIQGGSTITQQLIKNYVLSNERSYRRKIQEAYLAMQLEEEYSKDQILEFYINKVHYGGSNYGIKSAAKDYFNKELDELTIRECALLAGVINNASVYNPRKNYYDTENRPNGKKKTDDRTNIVLNRMFTAGYITVEEYEAALKEPTVILENSPDSTELKYPEFVEYAIENVIDMFLKMDGLEDTAENRKKIEKKLKTSGYHIYTTLDPEIQDKLEEAVYTWDNWPTMKNKSDSYEDKINVDGSVSRVRQPQVAAAIIDYKTGHVVALVGGRDRPTAMKMATNRAYQSRQPVGSSIKPIAVYAPAIDSAGLGTSTAIQNIEGPVKGWNVDSSGKKFPNRNGGGGPVTLKEAVVNSLNLSAARTLMELMGDNYEKNIQVSMQYLKDMGISDEALYPTGSGLALGTNGMTVIEQAGAFGTIANKGTFMQPIAFTKVVNADGEVILDASKVHDERDVFKRTTAWMMVDILTEAVRSGTGKRAQIPGMQVAGKTGSNDSYKGITFAGFTPYYSCAVWIGSDEYQPLSKTYGGNPDGAAPLWQRIMASVHEDLNGEGVEIMPEDPESIGLKRLKICGASGLLAGRGCGHYANEGWFASGDGPTETCDWHRYAELCKDTGMRPGPYCPNVGSSSYVSIPEDADIRSIGIENLRRYYTYGGGSSQKCTLHTQEWFDSQPKEPVPVPTGENPDVLDLQGE